MLPIGASAISFSELRAVSPIFWPLTDEDDVARLDAGARTPGPGAMRMITTPSVDGAPQLLGDAAW